MFAKSGWPSGPSTTPLTASTETPKRLVPPISDAFSLSVGPFAYEKISVACDTPVAVKSVPSQRKSAAVDRPSSGPSSSMT